jgi:hypothetical protein
MKVQNAWTYCFWKFILLNWSFFIHCQEQVYNQSLSPLMLWVWISIRARCTTLCDKVCQWLATGRWFSPGPPVSSIRKSDRHDITEILLKVALNTIKQTNKQQTEQVYKQLLLLSLRWAYEWIFWRSQAK